MIKPRGKTREQVKQRRSRRPENIITPLIDYDKLTADNIPDPPTYLGDIGRTLWSKIIQELIKAGTITLVDIPTLENYCRTYEKLHEAEQENTYPIMVVGEGDKEKQIPNPFTSLAVTYSNQLRQLASELGFTPTSRKQVSKTPPKEKESKWGKFR